MIYTQSAVEFTGSASYIRITDHPDLHLDEFTLACWVMPQAGGEAISTGATAINIVPLISRGAHDPSNLHAINFRIGIREEDQILFLEFESWSDDEEAYINQHISGFTSLQYDNWYHIAASFDGRRIRLYTNGILESMLEVFFQPESSLSADMGIACAFHSGSSPTGSFRGKIDALRILNRDLSQAEILEIMNVEVLPGAGNLVLGFDFNEGSGSTLTPLGSVPASHVIPLNLSRVDGTHFSALVPPLSEPAASMKIGIISDPQYCDCETPSYSQRMYRETLNKLSVAIDTLNNLGVDFSITLGDIIDTFFVSYDSILPLYEAFGNEHYFLLGNHDFAIEDSEKPQVSGLLDMPDYYYSLDQGNWKFLFLDGTELGAYTRVLHPEYAEEGDSLRQSVSGEIHDKPWNGGISRIQQSWIRDQLEAAADQQQNLILFCHFPVLPDSVHLNLWNKDSIINLIRDYDHVVAYINGHFHEGGYDHRYGKHFLTHYSMVETIDSNSFSILSIHPSSLKLKGYGFNPDRTLRYKDHFRELHPPQLDNTILHYYHTAGDFVTIPSLTGYSGSGVNFGLIGSTLCPDNEFFMIRGDSLFLQHTPDYLQQSEFSIRLGAITHLHDSVSALMTLRLDPRAAQQHYPLPDTALDVGNSYLLELDTLFTDFTEEGLEYSFAIMNPDIVTGTQIDLCIQFTALKYGHTRIAVNACDSNTGTLISDTFSIQVNDPENIAPVHTDPNLLYVHFADTIRVLADTLFSDANNDPLIFTVAPLIDPGLHALFHETGLLGFRADVAMTGTADIIANDQRGGSDTLTLHLKFNTPPEKTVMLDSLFLSPADPPVEILLDSVYLDVDRDEISYSFQHSCDFLVASLTDNILTVGASDNGQCSLFLHVDDRFGGILSDTLVVTIHPDYTWKIHSASGKSIQVFPNPAISAIQIRMDELPYGICYLRLYDQLGMIKRSRKVTPENREAPSVSLSLESLPPGIYYLEVSSHSMVPLTCRFVKISSD